MTAASPLDLVRPDLRGFAGYASARLESPTDAPAPEGVSGEPRAWLNANESAWANPADAAGTVRRYPDPQPERLRSALAALYGARPEQVLVGRGSDEAIDLLVRATCAPGADAIAITPPTFGMYAVSAALNATAVLEVPQREDAGGWVPDLAAVAATALAQDGPTVRAVFLTSPGNPTGALVPLEGVRDLAARLSGRCLVVVDEAYLEFAGAPSATTLLDELPNVAVLRTLSKAHGLAGARIGAVLAHPELIAVLGRCQAPYPLPAPSVALACRALESSALARTAEHVRDAARGRERLSALLEAAPGVRRVHPSAANFVLARFEDPQRVLGALTRAGVVVRDLRDRPGLADALRISVGTPDELDLVEAALTTITPETTTPAPTILENTP